MIKMVSQDRWSLVRGSITRTLKCRTFCQEYVVYQEGEGVFHDSHRVSEDSLTEALMIACQA